MLIVNKSQNGSMNSVNVDHELQVIDETIREEELNYGQQSRNKLRENP